MLMKTRHLVILLSHYLAISYHLELPPADGLSLFHSTFTCEHSTREQGKENCEWWLLVFAVCLLYHVPSYCTLPYEALDKVFKIKMHWWPHWRKVPVIGVPKKRGCGEKKASVLSGANLLLAKSSKAAALSLFLLGILWHYALKVVGNVFSGRRPICVQFIQCFLTSLIEQFVTCEKMWNLFLPKNGHPPPPRQYYDDHHHENHHRRLKGLLMGDQSSFAEKKQHRV